MMLSFFYMIYEIEHPLRAMPSMIKMLPQDYGVVRVKCVALTKIFWPHKYIPQWLYGLCKL